MSLISGGTAPSVRIVASFPRRGLRRIEPPTLIVSDALELARVVRLSAVAAAGAARPPAHRAGEVGARRGEKWRRATGAAPIEPFGATEIDGLRPYRQGTPASRIHWAALARGAGLLERRLRADTETRPLVVVDARCDGPPDHLDAAVRAAASLVLELGTRTGCGLLLPGEFRPLEIEPDLGAWPVAHARLAMIEGGPETRAPGLAPGARSAQVLTSRQRGTLACPPGWREPASGPQSWWFPKALATQPRHEASFEVAGCLGFVVGAGRRRAGASGVTTHTQVAVLAPLRRESGRAAGGRRGERSPARPSRPRSARSALYGVVRWGTMLQPAPTWRLLGLSRVAVALAGLAPVLLERERTRRRGRGRASR